MLLPCFVSSGGKNLFPAKLLYVYFLMQQQEKRLHDLNPGASL